MENTYFSIVTDIGTKKMMKAVSEGKRIALVNFAVGDGGGTFYTPTGEMLQLKNEVWRGNIHSCEISEESENILVVESVIPANVGGFVVREMGVFDEEGDLIAICNTPDTLKVKVDAGVVYELDLSMEIALSNTDAIQLIIDPNIVTATKKNLEQLRILLEKEIETKAPKDHTHYIDLDEIDRAFLSVFTHVTLEPEPTAMSAEDIEKAINTPWDGTSSSDPNALSAEEIEQAMNTEWDGTSSDDPNALSAEEINEAIANVTK